MFIGKVRGNVVTTQKVPKMVSRKLLLVEALRVDEQAGELKSTGRTVVAVDALGAGESDFVLVTEGSSARLTDGTSDAPVDCVVIGIVDSVHAMAHAVYERNA